MFMVRPRTILKSVSGFVSTQISKQAIFVQMTKLVIAWFTSHHASCDLKNEDDLKNKDNLKNEDDLKKRKIFLW